MLPTGQKMIAADAPRLFFAVSIACIASPRESGAEKTGSIRDTLYVLHLIGLKISEVMKWENMLASKNQK